MFHVNRFWAEPQFLNHHSSRRVAAVGLILLDLGLEALENNIFIEKWSGKMCGKGRVPYQGGFVGLQFFRHSGLVNMAH